MVHFKHRVLKIGNIKKRDNVTLTKCYLLAGTCKNTHRREGVS